MLLQNNLLNAPSFSLMANECMDITVVKEFSIYCHWIENEAPVEHFMEKLPLKKHMVSLFIQYCERLGKNVINWKGWVLIVRQSMLNKVQTVA